MTLLLSLTSFSLSQQVSLVWCYGACCPLFSVLSAPSWLRQMAALPGSGSDGGFFLLKGSFFSPQSHLSVSVAAPPRPLMQLCRLQILQLVGRRQLKRLPLPGALIRFLQHLEMSLDDCWQYSCLFLSWCRDRVWLWISSRQSCSWWVYYEARSVSLSPVKPRVTKLSLF